MNVLELAVDRGLKLKKKSASNGGEYAGPCPWCGGVDRFIIQPAKHNRRGRYFCRKCPKHGDNIQFLRDLDGLSYQEACEKLGEDPKQRRDCSYVAPKPKWEPTEHKTPDERWRTKATEFVEKCADELQNQKGALKWLESRGISAETARRYKLGWHSGRNGKSAYRNRKGWGLEELKKEDGKLRPLWLPVGLVIPCFVDGQVHRIRIRRKAEDIKDGGLKYYIIPGSKNNTLVLEPARKVFVIVEAELDAMAIVQAGDIAGAVAVGSLENKPDVHATEVLRKALWIYNALDFEIGGKSSQNGFRAMKWWEDNFENCERYPVPRGKDPGEAVAAGVDLGKWIEAGLPPLVTVESPVISPGPEMVDESREQLAPEVLELERLITKVRVALINTDDMLGFYDGDEGFSWRHRYWKDFSRMSDLVFKADPVWDYLRNHPADIITSENFIYGGVAG